VTPRDCGFVLAANRRGLRHGFDCIGTLDPRDAAQ
jgi:hypothetical protein